MKDSFYHNKDFQYQKHCYNFHTNVKSFFCLMPNELFLIISRIREWQERTLSLQNFDLQVVELLFPPQFFAKQANSVIAIVLDDEVRLSTETDVGPEA